MGRFIPVTDEIYDYLLDHGTPADHTYAAIREETERLTGNAAGMQIGADQYAFMRMLVGIAGVDLAVEVGTFTGSSAAAVAAGTLAPERLQEAAERVMALRLELAAEGRGLVPCATCEPAG